MKTIKISLIFVSISIIAAGSWWASKPAPLTADTSTKIVNSDKEPVNATSNTLAANDPLTKLSEEKQQLGMHLRERFGSQLDQPLSQIQLLDFLIRQYKKKFPNDWEERIREIILAAFPQMADALLAKLAAYLEYATWMENIKNLEFESKDDVVQATWDKRKQLFGADAEKIWVASLQKQKIIESLENLKSSTAPLPDKINSYVTELVTIFGEEVRDVNKVNTTELMTDFLQLESVQSDLHQLPPDEQRQTLRELRAAMGLNEEALIRWEALDTIRAERRVRGEQYMASRAELEHRYSGDALNDRLQALQNQQFGREEAEYIRNEEASGFYRYSQPQFIGVD